MPEKKRTDLDIALEMIGLKAELKELGFFDTAVMTDEKLRSHILATSGCTTCPNDCAVLCKSGCTTRCTDSCVTGNK